MFTKERHHVHYYTPYLCQNYCACSQSVKLVFIHITLICSLHTMTFFTTLLLQLNLQKRYTLIPTQYHIKHYIYTSPPTTNYKTQNLQLQSISKQSLLKGDCWNTYGTIIGITTEQSAETYNTQYQHNIKKLIHISPTMFQIYTFTAAKNLKPIPHVNLYAHIHHCLITSSTFFV